VQEREVHRKRFGSQTKENFELLPRFLSARSFWRFEQIAFFSVLLLLIVCAFLRFTMAQASFATARALLNGPESWRFSPQAFYLAEEINDNAGDSF
jgi:hypothetical protein